MTEIDDPTELEDAIENIHAKYRKKMVRLTITMLFLMCGQIFYNIRFLHTVFFLKNSELIALQSEAATNLKTKSSLSEEEVRVTVE